MSHHAGMTTSTLSPHTVAFTPYITLIIASQASRATAAKFFVRQHHGRGSKTKAAEMNETQGSSGYMMKEVSKVRSGKDLEITSSPRDFPFACRSHVWRTKDMYGTVRGQKATSGRLRAYQRPRGVGTIRPTAETEGVTRVDLETRAWQI